MIVGVKLKITVITVLPARWRNEIAICIIAR